MVLPCVGLHRSIIYNVLWLLFALSFLWFPYIGMVTLPCRQKPARRHAVTWSSNRRESLPDYSKIGELIIICNALRSSIDNRTVCEELHPLYIVPESRLLSVTIGIPSHTVAPPFTVPRSSDESAMIPEIIKVCDQQVQYACSSY